MEQLISTEHAARFLGITRPTVIKYINEGRLNASRTGKAYKITKPDLVSFGQSIGINGKRLSELDAFLRLHDKKTRSLAVLPTSDSLVLHDPPRLIETDPDAAYFLSVRTHPDASEIVCRVEPKKFFIGRHSLASLSIQDPYVSTLHATLLFREGMIEILDQSTNGTVIRSRVLKAGESQIMGDGDQFRVGKALLTIISPRRIDTYLSSLS